MKYGILGHNYYIYMYSIQIDDKKFSCYSQGSAKTIETGEKEVCVNLSHESKVLCVYTQINSIHHNSPAVVLGACVVGTLLLNRKEFGKVDIPCVCCKGTSGRVHNRLFNDECSLTSTSNELCVCVCVCVEGVGSV